MIKITQFNFNPLNFFCKATFQQTRFVRCLGRLGVKRRLYLCAANAVPFFTQINSDIVIEHIRGFRITKQVLIMTSFPSNFPWKSCGICQVEVLSCPAQHVSEVLGSRLIHHSMQSQASANLNIAIWSCFSSFSFSLSFFQPVWVITSSFFSAITYMAKKTFFSFHA